MRDRTLWTWHIGTGLVILVLLGLHMMVMHLDDSLGIFNPAGGHPIEWQNVLARMQSTFFTVTYVLLLGALHGPRHITLRESACGGLVRFLGSSVADLQKFVRRDIKGRCQVEQALVKQTTFAQFNVDQQVSREARAKRERLLGEAATGADPANSLPDEDAGPLPDGDALRI